MSRNLTFAHARGWDLANTLMTCVVVFHDGAGDYGVMPSTEYDGDPAAIVHEFDPFQS